MDLASSETRTMNTFSLDTFNKLPVADTSIRASYARRQAGLRDHVRFFVDVHAPDVEDIEDDCTFVPYVYVRERFWSGCSRVLGGLQTLTSGESIEIIVLHTDKTEFTRDPARIVGRHITGEGRAQLVVEYLDTDGQPE
jgi:hypothetical protein